MRYQAYTLLHTYFEEHATFLRKCHFVSTFSKLERGTNVMNLTNMDVEVQSLVIQSVLEHVLKEESNVITVIPDYGSLLPRDEGIRSNEN